MSMFFVAGIVYGDQPRSGVVFSCGVVLCSVRRWFVFWTFADSGSTYLGCSVFSNVLGHGYWC